MEPRTAYYSVTFYVVNRTERKRVTNLAGIYIFRPTKWKRKILCQFKNWKIYKDLYEKALKRDWMASWLFLTQILLFLNVHKNFSFKDISLTIRMPGYFFFYALFSFDKIIC